MVAFPRSSKALTLTFLIMCCLMMETSGQNVTTNSSQGNPPYVVTNQPSQSTTKTSTTKAQTSGPDDIYACQLQAVGDFRERLSQELNGNIKLVEIDITLKGYPSDLLTLVLEDVHRPKHWVRTANRQGKSLLMLDESYSYMSLSTLSIGVSRLKANLSSEPSDCLYGKRQEALLKVMRRSFLNDFKILQPGEPSGSLSSDEYICNMHVVPNNGYARFQYTCCHNDPDGNLVCEEVIKNDWLRILIALVIVIKVLVVLYSPMFIPESMYRLKYVAAQYNYHTQGPPVSVKVVVTQDPDQFGPENKHKRVRLSQLKNMEYFKALVGSSRWIPERVYEVKVKDVCLSVKARRLLTRNSMPVTIFKLLYNNLLRCRIRRLAPLTACCETNILGKFNPGLKIIKWSQLMRIVSGFLLLIILFIPWIIRVTTYHGYDQEVYEQRKVAAARNGLEMEYAGSLVIYLSPLHGLFVIIYIIFIFDSVVYGVISKPMKEKLKFVLRQCLRDMKERSRLVVVGWMTKLLLWPFETFGILGLIFFPIYLVIVLIFILPIAAFYFLPTLNLTIRLLIHLFIFMCPSKVTEKFENMTEKFSSMRQKLNIREVTANESFIKRSNYTAKGIILQLVVIIMCLISFWSLTLLIMEVSSFFVELLVYTFMGVIVNAAIIMKYVTVIFLLYLYGKQIFSSVSKEYQDYHRVIHDQLLEMKRPEINEIAKKEALDQENTAFTVTGTMATNISKDSEPCIRIKENQPQWYTTSMLLFLDQYDNPLTPEKFFHETIDLNYFGCPGPVYKQVIDAVLEFSKVILFLLFVFIVVMAFGDAYQVSTTNQLLATVAGGFVPFLFRYIFNANTGGSNVDTSSIQFITEFHKAINAYTQSWNVFDIKPASVKEWDEDKKKEKENGGNMDGNGSQGGGDALNTSGDANMNSSGAPLLNSTEVDLNDSMNGNTLERGQSHISILEDQSEVDIIVDVSSPKTRSVNALLTKGFEKGSVTMLDRSTYSRTGTGTSARVYRPQNERAIDVV